MELRGGVFVVKFFCMKKYFGIKYDNIISIENLLKAWEEFLPGKKTKTDVCEFAKNLMENIFDLHDDLVNKNYKHGKYKAFNISDPKPRNIHKASVRDRLLDHAIYRILYPAFDKIFFSESYSCRVNKGTHKAMNKFRAFAYKESKNHRKTLWILKCDIRKFFASIDHPMLLKILSKHAEDQNMIWLFEKIISSFHTTKIGVGLPLGNLTSQLLVNIYMNEFDQWVKHQMKVRYYIRYADDFIFLSKDKDYLLELVPKVADFLDEELKLTLHPKKITIKAFVSGVDFLGWLHFIDHRVLRTSTKRRAIKALKESENANRLYSYKGLLSHGNQFVLGKKFSEKIEKLKSVNEVNSHIR